MFVADDLGSLILKDVSSDSLIVVRIEEAENRRNPQFKKVSKLMGPFTGPGDSSLF